MGCTIKQEEEAGGLSSIEVEAVSGGIIMVDGATEMAPHY